MYGKLQEVLDLINILIASYDNEVKVGHEWANEMSILVRLRNDILRQQDAAPASDARADTAFDPSANWTKVPGGWERKEADDGC